MSKEKTMGSGEFVQSFFRTGLYKSSQGRIARQVTFAVLAVAVGLASWRLYETLRVSPMLRSTLNWATNLVVSADETAVAWNPSDPIEVDAARRRFEDLRVRGYEPRVDNRPVAQFDPAYGSMAFVLEEGAYRHPQWLRTMFALGLPLLALVVGGWLSYRLVNMPRFADFLVAVEAEMNKVSWPSRSELMRSAFVVIFMIFALAVILFSFDVIWRMLFERLGIVI